MTTLPGLNHILIYSDGACSGNPGPGGYGAIVALPTGQVIELGGGHPSTTNNAMEMTGVLEALLKVDRLPGKAVVYTDSVYVIRGITQWVHGWSKRGWKTADGKDVANKDIWEALQRVVQKRGGKNIEWRFIRGHKGIPGNERCDEIAVSYSKGQSVYLYKGDFSGYSFDLLDLPAAEALPEMKDYKNAEKKVAYSYLSLVNGKLEKHKTWGECEARVKGRPGARFKKAMSAEEEAEILKSWGL